MHTPVSYSIARIFILVNALIWLAFAVIVAAGLHPGYVGIQIIRWTYSVLAFLTSGVLILFYFLLSRRSRPGYILTIAFLVFISVLTIADEVGVVDLLVFAVAITPVILLLAARKWYFHRNSQKP